MSDAPTHGDSLTRPDGIELPGVDKGDEAWAGVGEWPDGWFVNVGAGGSDYDSTGNCRLSADEAARLRDWLTSALDWLAHKNGSSAS